MKLQSYSRERIKTQDDDFLDLDWIQQGAKSLVIISHGLEGNSQRAYIKGMARVASMYKHDVLAWNYRGCSEEMNKQLRFYHSGATEDLADVVTHAISKGYKSIYLIGFSLGGNLTLKYLGESDRPQEIKKAVAFSVPMDLEASCEKISQPSNWVYARRFLKSLEIKIIQKSKVLKELDPSHIQKIRTLKEFDDAYTGPIHGYKDAHDYYFQNSSIRFVTSIKTPTLIVSALNDPFLTKECYPTEILKDHPYVNYEYPERGGHVGFAQFNKNGVYWSEERAMQFISS